MPFNHLILCCPLLLLPSTFPSIRVFSNESVLRIRWPKYWSFSFSISPSNEYSGLILFRMDWLDLLAVQGTLKSLPQHHSSKASVACSFKTLRLHTQTSGGGSLAEFFLFHTNCIRLQLHAVYLHVFSMIPCWQCLDGLDSVFLQFTLFKKEAQGFSRKASLKPTNNTLCLFDLNYTWHWDHLLYT